jgi:hypothetical protein
MAGANSCSTSPAHHVAEPQIISAIEHVCATLCFTCGDCRCDAAQTLPQLSARRYWADGRASVGATDDDDVIQLRHTRQASYGSRAASAISPLSGTQGQYLRQETAKTPRITLDSTLPPSYLVAIIFPLSVQSTIRPTFLQMTDHRGEGILAPPSAVSRRRITTWIARLCLC